MVTTTSGYLKFLSNGYYTMIRRYNGRKQKLLLYAKIYMECTFKQLIIMLWSAHIGLEKEKPLLYAKYSTRFDF